MKKLIPILIALWCSFPAFSQTENTTPLIPLITTTGEAIVYAAPDEILMDLSITTYDEQIAEARKKNRDISQPVIKYLREAGIEPQHIQTQYMSVTPVKQNYKSDKILHYQAIQTIAICITDLSQYEDIVDQLLELKVTSIGSPRFRTTDHRKLKDEARQKAILAAREKAELLAKTLGQKIGKAYSINEIGNQWNATGQNAYANSFGQDAPEADGGQAFAPGQLEIRATVEVSFYLK